MHSLLTKTASIKLPVNFLAAITTMDQFKGLMSSAIGLVVMVSFLLGVGAFIFGIYKRNNDPETAKAAFIGSFLLAIAVPAVSLMFALGGVGGAVADPKFSN